MNDDFEKLNKYSLKIKNFLDNNAITYYIDCKNSDSLIIRLISDTFKQSTKKKYDITNIKHEIIKKLHEYDDSPLLYIILGKEMEIIDKMDFYKWIRINFRDIDLKGDKYKKYHNILFNPCANRKELHNMMYDGIFVSLDVLHHSESENLIYDVYKNDKNEIHVYTPESETKSKLNINLVLQIFDFYRTLTKKNLPIKLVVFYGSQKKLLSDEKPICSDNVNSGSTMAGEIIHIWRKEEFYKVLIHELVHYFSIDFYTSDQIYKKINSHFKQMINIKGIDRINESYTEIFAIVVHSVIFSELNYINFDTVFSYELLFSYFQVAKLLNHFECEQYNDILRNEFVQTTSAFSYYIVKCMFMEKIGKVLQFWDSNGFVILGNAEDEYVELYKDIVKFESLDKNKINALIKLINGYANCFVKKTMRMSMFQIVE